MLNLEAIDREIKSLEKLQIRLVAAIRNAPKGTVFFRSSAKAGPVPYCSGAADPHGKRRKIMLKTQTTQNFCANLKIRSLRVTRCQECARIFEY